MQCSDAWIQSHRKLTITQKSYSELRSLITTASPQIEVPNSNSDEGSGTA